MQTGTDNNFDKICSYFKWFEFPKSCRILTVENTHNKFDFNNTENISFYDIINKTIDTKYDYILYIENPFDFSNYTLKQLLAKVKPLLMNDGHILMALINRFGAKFICGEADPLTKTSFDSITGNCPAYFVKSEIINISKEVGFRNIKFFYPYPDFKNPRLIYTDEYIPNEEIAEKLESDNSGFESLILSERDFIISAAKSGIANCFSNSFIIELSSAECSNLVFSCCTKGRKKERSFYTNIYSNNTVQKIPAYNEGKESLKRMADYHNELIKRNIPALPVKYEDDKLIMPRVLYKTLSSYIRDTVKNKEELFTWIDMLKKYIDDSSEVSGTINDIFISISKKQNLGKILKKAYFEMIPVNCFVRGNDLLFFDQEFVIENCPAIFIVFRCIHDIYIFIPSIESIFPKKEMIIKYGLSELWEEFIAIEAKIFISSYNENNIANNSINDTANSILRNRNLLKMNTNYLKHLYNIFEGYDKESDKLILFGSGKYADHYLDKYENTFKPDFIVDNDESKHGKLKRDIEVRSPDELNRLIYGTYRIIITVKQFQPIIDQLESMGIGKNYYRVFDRYYDTLIPYSITDTMTDGKYNIGYIPGAFDLFHIGHLNILRRSKERCHYLIAGVLTDEIIRDEKHKEPFIPFAERFEIVKQCKYVDRAIAVDKHNTDKLEAYKELHFGCMFSGSDHDYNNSELKKQLNILGSEIEIFPYTDSTSSTMLQSLIKNQIGSHD